MDKLSFRLKDLVQVNFCTFSIAAVPSRRLIEMSEHPSSSIHYTCIYSIGGYVVGTDAERRIGLLVDEGCGGGEGWRWCCFTELLY